MLRLKDSAGVNWCEELPDDPANPGGGLEVMSTVDSRIIVLAVSRMKSYQSSILIVLCRSSLASERKSPLASRKAL